MNTGGSISQTGLILTAVDITGRRQAEEKLRESEIWYRSLIENSVSVYAVVDAQGQTLYESPSLEKVYGWKPEEILLARELAIAAGVSPSATI